MAKKNTVSIAAIKRAVMDILKERIAYKNEGMLSRVKASPASSDLLFKNNVRIDFEGRVVTKDGEPLFRIERRWSQRKINLCYPELTPRLIPADAED